MSAHGAGGEPMSVMRLQARQRGVGLIEIMVGILISMLMVLIIYQVYLVSEGQKRTINAGSDAQQNASYGLFLIGQDLMGAGQVISSSMAALAGCAMLRPIPAVIAAGATDNDPDSITVFYGGSASLSTPAPLLSNASVASSPPGTYVVAGPLAFSPNDVVVAVQGTNCTLSTINALISFAAVAERPARLRTSVATTANPRPCSPARAASTAAFSASRLVWNAISSITLMMSAIFLLLSLMPFIVSTTSATTSPPLTATSLAPRASWSA
jgi:Tfp pilus assembly protein PilW